MNRPGRPPRDVVARLLAADGQSVHMTETELLEDVDGRPLGVFHYSTAATLVASLPLLGWTEDEWNDPNITE